MGDVNQNVPTHAWWQFVRKLGGGRVEGELTFLLRNAVVLCTPGASIANPASV